jgi:hypothetical protein
MIAEKQWRKDENVLNPLVWSDKLKILYHDYIRLKRTCMYAGDITITIVDSKEDSAAKYGELEDSTGSFATDRI